MQTTTLHVGDVTRQGSVEKKDNWVVICSRQPSSTMVV